MIIQRSLQRLQVRMASLRHQLTVLLLDVKIWKVDTIMSDFYQTGIFATIFLCVLVDKRCSVAGSVAKNVAALSFWPHQV